MMPLFFIVFLFRAPRARAARHDAIFLSCADEESVFTTPAHAAMPLMLITMRAIFDDVAYAARALLRYADDVAAYADMPPSELFRYADDIIMLNRAAMR